MSCRVMYDFPRAHRALWILSSQSGLGPGLSVSDSCYGFENEDSEELEEWRGVGKLKGRKAKGN